MIHLLIYPIYHNTPQNIHEEPQPISSSQLWQCSKDSGSTTRTSTPQTPKPNHFHPPSILTIHLPVIYFQCYWGTEEKEGGWVTACCKDNDRPKICYVARPFTGMPCAVLLNVSVHYIARDGFTVKLIKLKLQGSINCTGLFPGPGSDPSNAPKCPETLQFI